MPRVKQTDQEKLATLKEKLEKAKKLKDQWTRSYNSINAEIEKLEQKAKYEVMNSLVEDEEKLKSLFDLGIINEEQYKALSKRSSLE